MQPGLETVPISPWLVTLFTSAELYQHRNSRYRHAKSRCLCADHRPPMSLCQVLMSLCIDRRYHYIEWWVLECFIMFHNVLRVFHDVLRVVDDVLLVVHKVSQCFTSVSWCVTMFNNILLCLVSRAMIGIAVSVTVPPPIAVGPQGSRQCCRDRR